MQRFTKALAVLMLTVAVFCTAGCTKPDDPNNPNNGGNNGGSDNSEIINPMYVQIDWDNAVLLSANDSIGDYQIQFSGEMPELRLGSIVTIDRDTVVRYVFIESVIVEGKTVRMNSSEAYLTDIFASTDFTLATSESSKSSAKGKVFYPTEIYQYGDDAVFRKVMGSRDDGFGFTHNLWHFGENFDGEDLLSGDNYRLYMEKLNFDFDVDLEMYMNFSGRTVHEIVGNAIDRYRSRAMNINAYLKGSFNTEQKVRCEIWGSCSWNPNYDIWKHNLFRPLYVRFIVYGVPVVIKVNSDLYRQVQVAASGEISASTGFTDNAEGRLGFEWQQSGGMTPIASFSNTFDFTPPSVVGIGEMEAKAWAFPRIRLLLYGLVGPSFDIKPYLSTKLSGGFKAQLLDASDDFCAWSLDCNTGLDACCGLSLQFMGYEIENFSTPNWNVFEKTLYHSPKYVKHVSKSEGQMKIVKFNVFDHNYLLDMDVITPLPQFVKFEANGHLSSGYGIAINGQTSVNWTPTNNDILYAKLYDINGDVMAWDTVKALIELPSVTTAQVTNIAQTTATCGGTVLNDGGSPVIERGLCWGMSNNPSLSDNHTIDGSSTGNFTSNITGLSPGVTYYVRAYATNSAGTGYGETRQFTTSSASGNYLYYGGCDIHSNNGWDAWGGVSGQWEWAVLFPSSILSQYSGFSITGVCAYVGFGSYTIKINGGHDTNLYNPNWNNFWYSSNISPISLTSSSDLWVSVSGTAISNLHYLAGTCAYGENNPNARWFRLNGGEWQDFYDVNGGYDMCWAIALILTDPSKGEESVEIV